MTPDDPEHRRTPASSRPRGHDAKEREAEQKAMSAEDSGDVESERFPSPNDLLGTLLGEASLWPLLIVILGSLGTFGAAMLILALDDQNPFAAIALLLVFGMSADLWIRSRRRAEIRHIARLVALLWISAIGLALVAFFSGIT